MSLSGKIIIGERLTQGATNIRDVWALGGLWDLLPAWVNSSQKLVGLDTKCGLRPVSTVSISPLASQGGNCPRLPWCSLAIAAWWVAKSTTGCLSTQIIRFLPSLLASRSVLGRAHPSSWKPPLPWAAVRVLLVWRSIREFS